MQVVRIIKKKVFNNTKIIMNKVVIGEGEGIKGWEVVGFVSYEDLRNSCELTSRYALDMRYSRKILR